MSRTSVILRNAASNWTGFAINAAVTLVLTPFILREIGVGRYGIWVLTSSIVGYYGMLDLGFRAGVVQFLTRSLAVPDFDRASDVISTAVAILGLLGIVMAVLSVGGAFLAPGVFDLPPGTEQEAFWCILIIGATAAVQCVLSPFSAVFTAKQRFDLSNLIGVTARLLAALGIVVELNLGHGLIGISAATGAATVLDYLVRWTVSQRLVPELDVSLRRVSVTQLRSIGAFGLWNFLISVSGYVYMHMQPLLIGALMPIAAVGHYALAAGLWHQINSLFTPVGHVLYPVAAELDVRRERETVGRLYRDGSRLLMLAVLPVVLVAYFWAEDFYRLWIGEEFLTGDPFASVASLLQIMLIATVFGYTSNVAGQILLGAGHIRQLALLQISGAALNLGASLTLIHYLGLAGVAISAVLATLLVDVIGIPLALNKKVGLHVLSFLRPAVPRLVSVALLLIVAFIGIRRTGVADDWLELILQGALAGVATAAAVLAIGVTSEERQRFLVQPARRLLAGDRGPDQ